jgi:hypothetical protein
MHADTNRASAGRGQTSHPTGLAAIAGGLLLAVLLVAGWGKPGHAAIPQDDPFANLEVLDAAEMAEKRGGFFDAILGINLNLTADIITKINGQQVLVSHVVIDAGGTTITDMPAATNLTGLTFLDSSGAAITEIASQNFLAPVTAISANGTSVTVPAGFQGLVAKSDTGGIVAAVSKITKEQFANLVINANADPNSVVQQDLNIDVGVEGFSGLQQNVRLNATLTRFRDAMRSASLGALGTN